jgi:hypothetical protein
MIISMLILVQAITLTSQAQGSGQNQPKPDDFFWQEVSRGVRIAAGREVLGTLLGVVIGHATCSPAERVQRFGCYNRAIYGAFIGLSLGTTIGATIGVVSVGAFFEVHGSAGLAFVGSVLGWASSLIVIGVLWEVTNSVQLLPAIINLLLTGLSWVVIPFSAGLGSALGFNLGATMEVKALSLTSKGLELVSARARW